MTLVFKNPKDYETCCNWCGCVTLESLRNYFDNKTICKKCLDLKYRREFSYGRTVN